MYVDWLCERHVEQNNGTDAPPCVVHGLATFLAQPQVVCFFTPRGSLMIAEQLIHFLCSQSPLRAEPLH